MYTILFYFILEKAKTLIIQNPWYNKVYSCDFKIFSEIEI